MVAVEALTIQEVYTFFLEHRAAVHASLAELRAAGAAVNVPYDAVFLCELAGLVVDLETGLVDGLADGLVAPIPALRSRLAGAGIRHRRGSCRRRQWKLAGVRYGGEAVWASKESAHTAPVLPARSLWHTLEGISHENLCCTLCGFLPRLRRGTDEALVPRAVDCVPSVCCRTRFSVRDQYTPGGSDTMQPQQAVHRLLEQVQANPASDEADRLDVIVVYDLADLQDRAGKWNQIAELLRMSGLRVEAAVPPHAVAADDWVPDPVWQGVARRLFSIRPRSTEPRPKPSAAPLPVDVDPAAWRSLLDLLGDEQRLRALIAGRRQPGEQLVRSERLAAARLREWAPEWREE